MVKKTVLCDLCGKEVSNELDREFRHFRVSEQREWHDGVFIWYPIDVHSWCLKKLLSETIWKYKDGCTENMEEKDHENR